jgi:hypothetical protein
MAELHGLQLVAGRQQRLGFGGACCGNGEPDRGDDGNALHLEGNVTPPPGLCLEPD